MTGKRTKPQPMSAAQRIKDAAYQDMVRDMAEAWKRPGGTITGDSWIDAVVAACGTNGDSEPLASYLEGAEELTQQQLRDLAGVLRLLSSRGEKRPRGKPGGLHLRWQRPHYLVAWFVEHHPPAERTGELITRYIGVINGWAFMR
ncbi:MAG: hypothetical protein ACXWJR_11820, partial [Xanthobacteraceae bacterium]